MLSTAVAQSLSRVLLFMTPWTAARQATLSSTISQSLLRLMCIESVMLFNHLVLCLPPSPFALHLSQHQGLSLICWLFASGGQSIGASASASVLPMNIQDEFLKIDWFDLLVIQRTHKSLLQHHISKASILQCSAFFMVQLSHPYMATGKTIALTR